MIFNNSLCANDIIKTKVKKKKFLKQLMLFSHPQQLHPVLILLPTIHPSVAFLSA